MCVCISGTEHSRRLKFSIQTYLTHINIIFEYCHGSVILYLKDGYVCRPVLKRTTMFFLIKKTFTVLRVLLCPVVLKVLEHPIKTFLIEIIFQTHEYVDKFYFIFLKCNGEHNKRGIQSQFQTGYIP